MHWFLHAEKGWAQSLEVSPTNPNDTLDRAVRAAYGWDEDPLETDAETILRRLPALNLEDRGNREAVR